LELNGDRRRGLRINVRRRAKFGGLRAKAVTDEKEKGELR
jgi:hypothetical protein